MLTFTFPRWQPLGLPPQVLGKASCGRCCGSGGDGAVSAFACRGTPVHAASASHSDSAHNSDPQQQQPIRRSRRRPRPIGPLEASVRGNSFGSPGMFDPLRAGQPGQDTDAVRAKVELVLRLKEMGSRFEWRGALKVFRRAKAGGVVPDNSVYSCIIGVVAKSGRWSEAVELLREARDVAGLEPHKYCYTAAVSACARGRNWELALSLLDEMREAGLHPDHVTYGSAVSAMARTGQWQRALHLLEQMAGEGLLPNVVCYGSAVDACAKGGQWEKAVELLGEMRDAGVEPDRICYNTAINACAQTGEWEIALALSDEMRLSVLGEGARPDVFTFNSIMHGMAGAGECERLLSVLGEMQAAGVSPDVVSYNTAMGALNKAGQPHRVLAVFEDMRAVGVTPDKETFSAAAEACACIPDDGDEGSDGGMGGRAMELMRMARDQGLRRPAAKAVAATLAACVGGGPWRRAIPAVDAMLVASGRHAWEDVMNFLAEAQLGRRSRGRGRRVLGGESGAGDADGEDGATVAGAECVAAVDRDAEGTPRLNGHNGAGGGGSDARVNGRAVVGGSDPPSPAGPRPGQRGREPGGCREDRNGGSLAASPGGRDAPPSGVRLQTRRVSDAAWGASDEAGAGKKGRLEGEDCQPRQLRPRPRRGSVPTVAAAAAASLELGGMSSLTAAGADKAP